MYFENSECVSISRRFLKSLLKFIAVAQNLLNQDRRFTTMSIFPQEGFSSLLTSQTYFVDFPLAAVITE